MISLRHIERQFGIVVGPSDESLRLSVYLSLSPGSTSERRSRLQTECRSQRAKLLKLCKSQKDEIKIRELFDRMKERLASIELPSKFGGVVLFGDQKQVLIYMLPRLDESFSVASTSFHIRPLLRIPEFFSRYNVLILHGGHAAGYLRQSDGVFKIFSYSPAPAPDEAETSKGRAARKRRKSADTLENALAQMSSLGDVSLCVFGPKQLRARFRRMLASASMRPPFFEAEADGSLEEIIQRADRVVASYPSESAAGVRSRLQAAKEAGRLTSDLAEIVSAAAAGAVESLIITSPDVIWTQALQKARMTGLEVNTITVSHSQMNLQDDCLLDDLCETVLQKGGQVSEWPMLRGCGEPAFAVLRWPVWSGRWREEEGRAREPLPMG